MRPSPRPAIRRLAAPLLVVAAVAATVVPGTTAGAEATSTLQYSVDGGATWASAVSVAPGGEVQVRHWFANTGDAHLDDVAVVTELPPGFTVTSGSTESCLNPSTTDVSAPDPTELRCASVDDAVWSGSALSVAPSAGHFGVASDAIAGPLAAGRVRYLNLHQCTSWFVGSSFNHSRASFLPSGGPYGGLYSGESNAGDVADVDPICDPLNFVLQPSQSGVASFELLGQGYLNLQQCRWVNSGTGANARSLTSLLPAGTWGTGSSTADAPLAGSCATNPAAGWTATPAFEASQALDLLRHRYLNLHECNRNGPLGTPSQAFLLAEGVGPTGTSMSNDPVPPGTSSCTFDQPGMTAGIGRAAAFDLLDTDRSAGYVTYVLRAPDAPSAEACADGAGTGIESFGQDATMGGPALPTLASSAQVSIDWSSLDEPCPPLPVPLVDGRLVLVGGSIAGAWIALRLLPRWRTAVG